MSPEMKRDFEHQWTELSPRLRLFLARKKVPSGRRDDLVQEVALRLLLMWPQVDRGRPLWPLAVTITMNLVRDEGRARPVREIYGDVPDVLGVSDVETSGLARVEIDRVRRAMAALTAPQRESLLKEIGAASGNGHSVDAEKMLRLRARRKLSEVLQDVSAVVLLRYRRSLEGLQALLSIRDGLAQSSVCILCLIAGISGGVVVETAPRAEAAPLDRAYAATRDVTSEVASPGSIRSVARASQASQAVGPDRSAVTETDPAKKPSKQANEGAAIGAAGGSISPPSLLPGGGDAPVPVPGEPPVPNAESPAAPAPATEPPPAPEPPIQAAGEVIATVEETTGAVLGK